jgi:hypothetical protein
MAAASLVDDPDREVHPVFLFKKLGRPEASGRSSSSESGRSSISGSTTGIEEGFISCHPTMFRKIRSTA